MSKHQKGYLYRRNGSWFVRFYDDIIQPDGVIKRKQCSAKLCGICDEYRNEKQVRPLADKFLAPINAGDVSVESTMPIATFIEQVYLPEIAARCRPSTLKSYTDIFNQHIGAATGRKDSAEISVHGRPESFRCDRPASQPATRP